MTTRSPRKRFHSNETSARTAFIRKVEDPTERQVVNYIQFTRKSELLLSFKARFNDGITLSRDPRSNRVQTATTIWPTMTREESVTSQLRRIVILKRPPLSRCRYRAFLHQKSLFALRNGETLIAASVSDLLRL